MASSNTQVSRLLVLGSDKDSNLAVIIKLLGLCDGSTFDAHDDDDKSDVAVLNLQTKYYRARVEVHMHQVLDNEPEPALHYDLHDYEAVICVVDNGQQESFMHMARFATRIVETFPYDVCLLVTSTLSTTTESVKQMESWCQGNGFEFVTLDCTEHTPHDNNVIDEKQGIERVLEALHCNMWRSMDMNPSKLETAAPLTEDVTNKSGEIEKKERQAEEEENCDDTESPRTSMDDSRLHTLIQALEIAEGPGASAGEGDNKENDIDMAELRVLISEVRNVRDQGQLLTNEQRRDRAAEVAMKIWNLLGKDDDASDSD